MEEGKGMNEAALWDALVALEGCSFKTAIQCRRISHECEEKWEGYSGNAVRMV